MNKFEKLLALSQDEKIRIGVQYTPGEIAQQPLMWRKALALLKNRREELRAFLAAHGMYGEHESVVILTGAGSSEFAGAAVCNLLRKRLHREVISMPTTHLVTHAKETLVPGHSYVVISFARSGNSPESLATYKAISKHHPEAAHIVITCNKDGKLAKYAEKDGRSCCIILPDETNDRSLVMTSSYSTMAFTAAGLAFLDTLDELEHICQLLCQGAKRIVDDYGDLIADFAALPFSRACFLGSDTLWGTMEECQLKLQEMTGGRVSARFDSFLGLRHGPQVYVNDSCAVIAALASKPEVRRYEMDLLRELKQKNQGCGTLVICDKADYELRELATHIIELYPDGTPVPDEFRIMTDVMVGQILGTFKSIDVGLKPDNPSASGMINRVVQGVVIYE